MVIQEITQQAVLEQCRRTISLSNAEPKVDDILIASILRRAAGYLSPCSSSALRAALLESMEGLTESNELSDRIDSAIERLLIGGDLLELNDVTTSDITAKGTWIYPAPPSFVIGPSGNIFLIGIVPDQEAFLPVHLMPRLVYDGFMRIIEAAPGEDLATDLESYGLRQIPKNVWLKTPREESWEQMLTSYTQMLNMQRPSGDIFNLTIIDPSIPVCFYKKRWKKPGPNHSGMFVGRRPQEFGAPIWGLVFLENGSPSRFLDLPKKQRIRWRGSDEAWLVQMAIDRSNSNPQQFHLSRQDNKVRFDFFSPLPIWARRRFMVLGESAEPENCLMSFSVPAARAQAEEEFLINRLWMVSSENRM